MKIYSGDGKQKADVILNEGSSRKATLMKEDYVGLSFSVATPILLNIGDYIDEAFGLYTFSDVYKPTYNTETGGWDYSVQVSAYYYQWKNTIFKYDKETVWALTSKIDVFLGVLGESLKANGYTYKGADIKFTYDPSLMNKAISLSFSKVNHINAINMIAEALETEWVVIGGVVHFGKIEFGEAKSFSLESNISNVTRSEASGTYANRLYAYGSTKNISQRYRKNLIFYVTDCGEDYIRDENRVLNETFFDKSKIVENYKPSKYSVTYSEHGADDVLGNISLQKRIFKKGFGDVRDELTYDVVLKNVEMKLAFTKYQGMHGVDDVEVGFSIEWALGDGTIESKTFYNRVVPCEIEDANTSVISVKVKAEDETIKIPKGAKDVSCVFKYMAVDGWVATEEHEVYGTVEINERIIQLSSFATKVTFLTGESAGKTYNCTYNPMNELVLEKANILRFDEAIEVEKNDTYIMPDLIERNVPYWYFTSDRRDEVASQAIVNRNLCLPKGVPYVEVEGITQAEVVEDVITNDEIFPHFLAYVSDVEVENGNIVDETTNEVTGTYPIYHITTDTEVAKKFSVDYIIDGEDLKICFSSGSLNGMTFDVLGGADEPYVDEKGLHLVIKRNETYGRPLPDIYMKPSAETENGADDDGTEKPKGDEFTLIGYDPAFVEDALVEDAEQRLLKWAKQQLAKMQIDPSTYTCTMLCDKAKEMGVLDIGQKVELKSKAFFKDGSRQSRVIGVEYQLDYPYDNPTYTFGESVAYSRLTEIESKVDNQIVTTSVTLGSTGNPVTGGNTTGITQEELQNEIESYCKDRYVSKVSDDKVSGLLTLIKGLQGKGFAIGAEGEAQFAKVLTSYLSSQTAVIGTAQVESQNIGSDLTIGSYLPKLTGGFFGKDEDGNTYIEADKLYIRMKAYFDSLEVNRVTYNCGKRIAGAAGIRVAKVVEMADRWRCYYLAEQDGITAQDGFSDGDLCFAEVFNGVKNGGVYQNYSTRRYWRAFIGKAEQADVDGYKYIDISKTDCEDNKTEMINSIMIGWESESIFPWDEMISLDWDTSISYWIENIGDAPEAGDYICQLGNKTDQERQSAIIENSIGTTAPSYTLYKGISTYKLVGNEMIDMGYDVSAKRAYLHSFGDFFMGDRSKKGSYIEFNESGELVIQISGTTIEDSLAGITDGLVRAGIDIKNGTITAQADKFVIKDSEGNVKALIGTDGKISNQFISLDPLTLTSGSIPTLGEIEGFAHYDIQKVSQTEDSSVLGESAVEVTASAVTGMLSVPVDTKTGKAYTKGLITFSAYSEGVSNYTINKVSELISVEYIKSYNVNTGNVVYGKIKPTDMGNGNYSFDIASLNMKQSFRISISATWKATNPSPSMTAQLTATVTAKVEGYNKTDKLLYSPDLSGMEQKTIVGANGFVSQGKGVLIHLQSTDETYEGEVQKAGVTFLCERYGMQISASGIRYTDNGGIDWNIGN